MILRNSRTGWWLPALAAWLCLVALAPAQQPRVGRLSPREGKAPVGGTEVKPPEVSMPAAGAQAPGAEAAAKRRKELLTLQPGEHPLMPALRWASEGIRQVEQIKDYSMVMVRRDRMSGKVGPYEYAFVKIRHEPMSVYMRFLAPDEVKGQEVIWIKGRNNGLMWAHGVGVQRTLFGTISLRTNGPVAMRGQRYPITEIGMLNMLRRLLEVGSKDTQYGECEVRYFENSKINGRSCTCIQVVHPVPRRNFLFYVARIFVDDELNLPVRYEAYDWPTRQGDPPLLSEEYTFLNLKVNVGFTEADFDIRNKNYDFP